MGGSTWGGPRVGCQLKFRYVVGYNFRSLSVVGKSQLIFLSHASRYFCPRFVGSQ